MTLYSNITNDLNKDKIICVQIANLLNAQNQLTIHYQKQDILKNFNNYIVFVDSIRSMKVTGFIQVKKLNYYSVEITHLSVHPDFQGNALGVQLLDAAEDRSSKLDMNIHILTATVRKNNIASRKIFDSQEWIKIKEFTNHQSGNDIIIYQKYL